jgi:hypothetical protein
MSLKTVIFNYVSEYLKNEKIYAQIGTISDINDTERSCIITPINGDSERKMRLQASLNIAEGLYIKPVDGSKVMFVYLNSETGVITCFSHIDSINLDVQNNITINGGNLGGLMKITESVDKLNIIEDSLNDLKNAISAWTPVPSDGGAALKTSLTTWLAQVITNTTVSDLENQKIKQ